MTRRQEKIKLLKRQCSDLDKYIRMMESEKKQLAARILIKERAWSKKATRLDKLQEDEYWSKPKNRVRLAYYV